MTRYEKLKISLRYWLLGMSQSNPNYLKCVEALEFASQYHTGLRKDGVTPEFEHQLVITHYIRSLINNLEYPVETICTSLLHDVPEDYDVSFEEINQKFGPIVARSVERLTKFHRGHKKTNEEYFKGIASDIIASICKGGDRIHNLQSMVGVFNKEKQKSYVEEAEKWILPSLKEARRNFPKQELAYENIKLMMNSQIELIKHTWG
jgi:(p)ppGpp synthase/HD superfamily hydrolase